MSGSDETKENAKQHSKNKWNNHKPTKVTVAVAGLVVYGLFVFFDIHEIWPWSRGWAVFVGILVTIALLYLEAFATEAINFRVFLICSAVIIFAGLAIHDRAPPILPQETDTHGWLLPRSEPTFQNACTGMGKTTDILVLASYEGI